MHIYDALHSIRRNVPLGVTTMSKCSCGREPRRGGEPCLKCLTELLVKAGADGAQVLTYIQCLDTARNIEASIIGDVGEGVEL